MSYQKNKIICPDCGYEMYVGFYETRHKNSKVCQMHRESQSSELEKKII